ncbi:DPP IV N-terminal domain-containing protein [Belliella marina]|uniref:DPP IV N-terminal domain-containing protein n=1 Tax=Belliella marina TaxID=1644146 RepID=A0ABW4VNS1_9BACT
MGFSKTYSIYGKAKQIAWVVLLGIMFTACITDEEEGSSCIDGCPNFLLIDYEPSWSPDGEWIAYLHVDSQPSHTGIYRIKPDGSENTLLIPGAQNPSWSPDSKKLAYSLGAQIWVMELESGSTEQLTFEGRNFSPNWNPDGTILLFRQSICTNIPCGVWMMEIGKSPKFLVSYGTPSNFHPTQELFVYRRSWVESDGDVLGDSLFCYNVKESENVFVTTLSSSEFISNKYFRFEKSGDSFLFSSFAIETEASSIFVMTNGNTKPQLLKADAHTADWAPDGRRIVYTNSNADNGRLHILDMGSNQSQQLTYDNQF